MSITRSYGKAYLFSALFILLSLGMLSSETLAANYPLEIIQPQPNLDTRSRYYKAYPGLEYNVRLAVVGGEYPYSYELTSAPAGMRIDYRGVITWSNPTAASTPYNVTAKVTDAQSNTRSVSWTIAVTTNGFRFIDAINGKSAASGGDGSINNPWKNFSDVYQGSVYDSKGRSTYAGEFLYWRNGTYSMDAYKEDSGRRVPLVGNRKPQVWLAYPGENPVFDMRAAQLVIYAGGDDLYFDGLEFDVNGNASGMGIQIDSSASRVTFRRNKLHGITNAATGGNNSLIFISKADVGNYWTFQDNEFFDVVENGYGILGYWARNVLIEDNTLHNINRHPIGPKAGTDRWFIRGNHMYSNRTNSISVQYAGSNGVNSGNMEISFNYVEKGGGKVTINSNLTSVGYPVYIYRNTFLDEAMQNKVTSSNGPFHWYHNVIVNDTSFPDKIERYQVDNPARLVVNDNLTGRSVDNIVDAQGYMTASYSNFIGIRGHVIDTGKRPMPPTIVNSQ